MKKTREQALQDIRVYLLEMQEKINNIDIKEKHNLRMDYLGIRCHYKEMKIGEVFGNSYEWDSDRDCSSYETEEPIEIDTCALFLQADEFNCDDWYQQNDNLDYLMNEIDKMLDRIKNYNCNGFGDNIYLIASDSVEYVGNTYDDDEGRYVGPWAVLDLSDYE